MYCYFSQKLSGVENGCRIQKDAVQNFLNEDSESKRQKTEKRNAKAEDKSVIINSNAPVINKVVYGNMPSRTKERIASTKGNAEVCTLNKVLA